MNGAIIVARQLVTQFVGPEGTLPFRKVAERARYCQLLAAKTKLPLLDACRLSLGAWVSALSDKAELIAPIIDKYNVNAVIHPESASDDTHAPEALLLALIQYYEELKEENPDLVSNLDIVDQALRRPFSDQPNIEAIIKAFIKVLTDEQFLLQLDDASGKILIVDPSEVVTPVLTVPLRKDGYHVTVAADVETGREALKTETPHLVIIEMRIPIVDGVTLCEEIKNDPKTSHLPVIMVSTRKGHTNETKCLRAGADEFIGKPVDLEVLFLKLNKLVKEPQAATSTGSKEGVTGSLEDMDFTDMIQILSVGGKSMHMTLTSEDREGSVFIENGEIVNATAGDIVGDDAFYELMRWKKGVFQTQQCDSFPERTIESPTMSLLMEGARQLDEA